MAKEYAKAFYNSEAWKKTRKAYYDSKGGMCERCQKEFEEGKRSLKSGSCNLRQIFTGV